MALPQVVGEFRCGGDPNLRFAPSGVAVCSISAVASSRKKQDDGSWVDDKTTWVELVAFKKLAENMAESFEKGDLVNVTGKLQVEDWEDKDGNKRRSVKVVVDTIGASAAFNPVKSIKTERRDNSGGGGSAPADEPNWGGQPNDDDQPPF